jgi:glycosyltransferase involved in cell wall biosynthesis
MLIADPLLPIPPPLYGGIERIVHFLAEELTRRGHEIALVCNPDSTCEANKIYYKASGIERSSRIKNITMLMDHLRSHQYDIIHSFAHYDMIAMLWPFRRHLIQSFQSIPSWHAFMKRIRWIPKRDLSFSVCGHHMIPFFEEIAPTYAIHNGIILKQFDFQPEVPPDAPLVFLGRIEPIKGTHTAIQIANQTGRDLVIAGNRSHDEEMDRYFIEQIEPHLNERIRYIGPVNDLQKNELLGGAAAMLMPIEWDEPFGIVMAEALACGTPVIGTARGALPEIVNNGITGAACVNIDQMIDAVRNLNSFSRFECRKSAEQRFNSDSIVEKYMALYEKILSKPLEDSKEYK